MLKIINNTSKFEYKDGILEVYNYGSLIFSGEVDEFMLEDTISELEEEGLLKTM